MSGSLMFPLDEDDLELKPWSEEDWENFDDDCDFDWWEDNWENWEDEKK